MNVRSRAEEKDHAVAHELATRPGQRQSRKSYSHKRMRKPHLGSVDGAIAGRLDERQKIVVSRVPDDLFERVLHTSKVSQLPANCCCAHHRSQTRSRRSPKGVDGCAPGRNRIASHRGTYFDAFEGGRRHDGRYGVRSRQQRGLSRGREAGRAGELSRESGGSGSGTGCGALHHIDGRG